jgi:hypothetical protein
VGHFLGHRGHRDRLDRLVHDHLGCLHD